MADQSQQAVAQSQNQQPGATPQQSIPQQQQQGNAHQQANTQQQQTVAPMQQAPPQQPTPQQVQPQPTTPQQVQQQQVTQPTIQQHPQQQPASVTNAAISITPQNAAAIFSGNNSMMTVSNPMVANAMTANALAGNAMAGATLQGSIPSQAMTANAMTVNAANLRSAIPQVQVIPQMQSTPYMQYPFNQQQIMLQNAAAMQGMSLQAAMQANAMNMNINPQINMANMNMAAMAMQQQRMGAGLMSPGPTTPTQNPGITFTPLQAQVSATVTSTGNNGKSLAVSKGQTTPSTPTQQAQATTLIGGKPIMPTQTNIAAQPLVLSVLPNQLTSTTGFVGSKGQSISLNQATPAQLISTQAPIRFSQPQLASSSGQINIQSQPIMTNQSILQAMATQLQQGAIPLGHQPLQLSASGQSPTILPGQPVYIRTTQIQGQQGVLAAQGVQIVGTPVKNSSQNNVAGVQIGKQTNQGQSVYPIKAVTARVNPTTVSKPKTAAVSGAPKNPKGRPRTVNRIVGAMTTSASTNTVASALSQSKAASQSKPATPTPNSLTVPNQSQSKSDSEMESTKKSAVGEKPEKTSSGKAIKQEKTSGNVSAKSSAPVKMDTSEPKSEVRKQENPSVVEKQKAIVKPHILTHVIEGFVIQEGPEPFPVQRSSLLTEFIPPKVSQGVDRGEEDSEMDSAGPSEVVPKKEVPEPEFFSKCEFCGTEEQASRFKRSKRFCTMACAKRYNRAHRTSVFKTRGKHMGIGRGMIMKRGSPLNLKKGLRGPGRGAKLLYGENREFPEGEHEDAEPMEEGEPRSTSNTSTSNESSSAPESPATPGDRPDNSVESDNPTTNPGKWTVTEVYEFIKSMPGCSPYAEEFKSQEIDGQALMLLKEDHLMTTMSMKLGPALKICAKINSFRVDLS
ncbi:polyhomeotic-like protein 1 isoform X1 [Ostrea edulis]|uniref:polyhomeotic-like protein 1 isoform X1 n=1 Tax=Ostrea edulis TaxID=37623 RepID=UPI0020964860|nr:polyhomeotic-like protein 1 isoform X1 [Ostrea edulis]XP_056019449.1 polyhomeotic-like protein 1 isoform X1 [Ostrea edulis]